MLVDLVGIYSTLGGQKRARIMNREQQSRTFSLNMIR